MERTINEKDFNSQPIFIMLDLAELKVVNNALNDLVSNYPIASKVFSKLEEAIDTIERLHPDKNKLPKTKFEHLLNNRFILMFDAMQKINSIVCKPLEKDGLGFDAMTENEKAIYDIAEEAFSSLSEIEEQYDKS